MFGAWPETKIKRILEHRILGHCRLSNIKVCLMIVNCFVNILSNKLGIGIENFKNVFYTQKKTV